MEEKNIQIFIASHKKFINRTVGPYIPLYVGKSNKNDLEYLGDDTGDNISSKNPNYCELTGLYWIWKNVDAEYVGLCHYRRYFVSKIGFYLKKNRILKSLNGSDIILPNKYKTKDNIKQNYKKAHNLNDLELARAIIEKKYPDYLKSFDKVMDSNTGYYHNMFICKKELMNEYCEWIFTILFELEDMIDISNYDSYQQRVFGFLSERLMNVWLDHKNLNIKEFLIRDLGTIEFVKFHLRNIYHKMNSNIIK